MNIGFVLLHYNNDKVTNNAIKYIDCLNNSLYNKYIIIVDNASPNHTGEILERNYGKRDDIYIILNKENLGFAKGNNIGYSYAKNKLSCNVIIVMNTDVFITDTFFLDKLSFYLNDAEIIAPDILGKNGVHQNPLRSGIISNKKLKYIYRYNKCISFLYKIPYINKIIADKLNKRKKEKNKQKTEKKMYDITPHGACIIFTEKWCRNEDIAFDPNTFMYMEEDIIMHYIVKHGYHTLYVPNLVVEHMEDASTDVSMKDILKKRIFIAKYTKQSACYLLKIRKLDKKKAEKTK